MVLDDLRKVLQRFDEVKNVAYVANRASVEKRINSLTILCWLPTTIPR